MRDKTLNCSFIYVHFEFARFHAVQHSHSHMPASRFLCNRGDETSSSPPNFLSCFAQRVWLIRNEVFSLSLVCFFVDIRIELVHEASVVLSSSRRNQKSERICVCVRVSAAMSCAFIFRIDYLVSVVNTT